jgi:OFA family oxalate/formate antiporter-like MFS transporter
MPATIPEGVPTLHFETRFGIRRGGIMMDRRWRIAGAVLLITALQSGSLLRSVLKARGYSGSPTADGVAAILSAIVFFFALRIQDRKGPFPVSTVGAVLFVAGWVLAIATGANSIAILLLWLGFGIGSATYIPVLAKWFPDKRGLAIGLGFLLPGANLIYVPLLRAPYSGQGWNLSILLLSIPVAVMAGAGAYLLRNPPANWLPPDTSPQGAPEGISQVGDRTLREASRSSSFPLLWAILFLGTFSGVSMIDRAVPLGIELAGLEKAVAAGGLGIMAIFTGLGAFILGAASDRAGRMRVAMGMFGLNLIAIILLFSASTFMKWLGAICLMAFSHGGFRVVIPATVADFFGTAHFGAVYGILYTAFLAGNGAANMLMGWIVTAGGSRGVPLAVLVASAIGLSICVVVKPPRASETAPGPRTP